MPFLEAIRLALIQIRVQKLKSFFTLLGVMIGVMFLIAVVSIVDGMGEYMEHDLIGKIMAVNSFEVRSRPKIAIGNIDEQTAEAYRHRPAIYERDTSAIIDALPTGFRHALVGSGTVSISSRYARQKQVDVINASATYLTIHNIQLTSGRSFSQPEDAANALVTVIGQDVKDHFFPGLDPIGRDLRIDGLPYRVVGIAEKQGSSFGLSLDKFIITPYGAPVKRMTTHTPGTVSAVIVQAPNATALMDGEEAVRQVLRTRHKLRPRQKDDFTLETPDSTLAFWNKLKQYLVIAGVILPMIGLIVGAIVIMNIMLVTVAERTHEIGIRKSLGARRRDILAQFLTESATLSTVGAAMGVGLGALIAFIIAKVSPLPTHVALWSVLVAVLIGTGVGIVAGVYPASRAARLDPILALRAE